MGRNPIACAVCRAEIPKGAAVILVDTSRVTLETFSELTAATDFSVATNDPAPCCSKQCARKRITRLAAPHTPQPDPKEGSHA